MAAVLLVALLVRLATAATVQGILHPDEGFQYAEQAHRLVFGTGLIPWEYQAGVRSWLFPGFLAGIYEVARLVGGGPVVLNGGVAIVMSLISLVPVLCGYLWGLRVAGLLGAVLAGGLNAVWSDAVLYGTHPLLDGVGASCLVAGVYLADRASRSNARRDFVLAGLALGLTLALRVQLAPALGVTVLLFCGAAPLRRGGPMLLGMAAVLLPAGLLDWATLGTPFQSIWYYVWVNLQPQVIEYFGTAPWSFYPGLLRYRWSIALFPLGLCTMIGAWRLPKPALIAATVVIALLMVGHKEARFLYPAILLCLTLAGMGTAVLCQWLVAALHMPRLAWPLGIVGLAVWAELSVFASFAGNVRAEWLEGTGMIAAMSRISADPTACAMAISPTEYWVVTGGYAHLRPGIRIVDIDAAAAGKARPGIDYVLTEAPDALAGTGLTLQQCWANSMRVMLQVCLWRNPTGCNGAALPEVKTGVPPFFDSLPRRR